MCHIFRSFIGLITHQFSGWFVIVLFYTVHIVCGWGYNLTLKSNNNKNPNIRTAGVDAAKIFIKDIDSHIPHFTPSLENQQTLIDQLLN